MAKLITESEERRTLHGVEFMLRRDKSGLTLEEFGIRLGKAMNREAFPRSYIWKFEQGDREISREMAKAIELVLYG